MKANYKDSYIAARKELVSLSVYNVGKEKCDSLHQWGPGIRDHYLIHYVISGKGYYMVNGKKYTLSPKEAFIIYPNTEISYVADKNDPWEYTWVGFNGSDASIILKATDFSKENPVIKNLAFGEEIQNTIMSIYSNRGNEFENAVEMTGQLYTLLSFFMKSAHKESKQNSANIYVQKSIEFITSNYSYPITIEDIASYVGISRSHLFRSFDATLNMSPKEFLTEFRIKQACYLLENSNLSITVIANSIGFDNSLYFSRAFKKSKNLSPKEYRQKKLVE